VEEVLHENELLRKATEQHRASPFVSQAKWLVDNFLAIICYWFTKKNSGAQN